MSRVFLTVDSLQYVSVKKKSWELGREGWEPITNYKFNFRYFAHLLLKKAIHFLLIEVFFRSSSLADFKCALLRDWTEHGVWVYLAKILGSWCVCLLCQLILHRFAKQIRLFETMDFSFYLIYFTRLDSSFVWFLAIFMNLRYGRSFFDMIEFALLDIIIARFWI